MRSASSPSALGVSRRVCAVRVDFEGSAVIGGTEACGELQLGCNDCSASAIPRDSLPVKVATWLKRNRRLHLLFPTKFINSRVSSNLKMARRFSSPSRLPLTVDASPGSETQSSRFSRNEACHEAQRRRHHLQRQNALFQGDRIDSARFFRRRGNSSQEEARARQTSTQEASVDSPASTRTVSASLVPVFTNSPSKSHHPPRRYHGPANCQRWPHRHSHHPRLLFDRR